MTDPSHPVLASQARDDRHIGHRVARSSAVLWGTAMLLRLLQLATTVVLARLLTPADYGVVVLALTIVNLMNVLFNLELSSAIVRLPVLEADHLDTAFTLGLIKGILAAAVLVLLAWPAAWWMNDPRLLPVMIALAGPSLIGSVHNPYFLLFARNLDFGWDARRQAGAAVAGSVVGIGAAVLLRSYWALVASAWATAIFTMALSYWRVPGRPRWCLTQRRAMISFGGWLTLIGVIDFVNSRVDYLLISRLGSRALGTYHIGQQVTTIVTGDIVGTISRTLLPAFSMLLDDGERLRGAYRQVQTMIFAIALPIGFGTSVLARDIVVVLVGRQWQQAVPVITYLGPLIALQSVLAGVDALALALDKGRLLFTRTAIFFVVRVSMMVIGFYAGGFMGIVYARVLSGSFFLIYGLGLAGSLVGSNALDPILASWRSIVSVAAMCAALTPLAHLSNGIFTNQLLMLIAEIALGGAVYLGAHALLWLMAGRPEGAETRLIDGAGRLLGRVRARR